MHNKSGRLIKLIIMALICLVGCNLNSGPPKPPIDFPFAVHKIGEEISADVQISKGRFYEFDLVFFYYGEGLQNESRKRLLAVLGDSAYRSKDFTYINPGIPVTIELAITGTDEWGGKLEITKKITTQAFQYHGFRGFNGAVGGYYGRHGASIPLHPGLYHFRVRTLNDIPELADVPVIFVIYWDPRGAPLDYNSEAYSR